MDGGSLGLAHFWQQADAVIRFTAYLLCAMSIVSWFLILWKTWGWLRVRRASRELDKFWWSRRRSTSRSPVKPMDVDGIFVPLAVGAASAASHRPRKHASPRRSTARS